MSALCGAGYILSMWSHSPREEYLPNLATLLCAISGHLGSVTAAVEELDKQVVGPPLEDETTCIVAPI